MTLLEREKALVRKYFPVRYVVRGRVPETGLDCYGLIINVYKDNGFSVLDIEEEYEEKWAAAGRNHFIENYHFQWDKVAIPKFLDVVLFKNSKGIADHGGIVIRNSRFLHCSKIGTTVGRLSDEQWVSKIEGFYHLRARND